MIEERDAQGRPVTYKDPNAKLDFGLVWNDTSADYLAGDIITTCVARIDEGDCVLDSHEFTGWTTTAWVSGGTDKTTSVLTFRITTAGGRVDERSMVIKVKNL